MYYHCNFITIFNVSYEMNKDFEVFSFDKIIQCTIQYVCDTEVDKLNFIFT